MSRGLTQFLVLVCWVALLPGCGPPAEGSLYDRLESEDPLVRVRAIVAAGERRNRQAVPLLVDRLSDNEDVVRMYAILALKRITGTTMGYHYAEDPLARDAAERQWRRWLAAGGLETQPATAPADPPT